MAKTTRNNRRLWITTGLLLAMALVGLVGVDIRPGDATPAATASQSGVTAVSESLGGSIMPALVKMVSALIVVVLSIYAAVYGLKRLAGSRGRRVDGHRILEVIETAYVAPKKTVSLVRVADKAVLIGVTDSQITMLTELNAEQTAAVAAPTAEERRPEISFARLLGSATDQLRRFGIKKKETVLNT